MNQVGNSRKKQLLKRLTPNRIWNGALLRSSYYLSQWTNGSIHWGKPMAISIEPTTACNLRCPQCPSGLRQFSRPTGNLNIKLNEEILDAVGKQLYYVNYYFQGEPYIHPQFNALIKAAHQRNIYTVTSTNAHFIDPAMAEKIITSGLSELIISIDGLTQETYESYRREGKLEKVIDGTRHLVAAKKKLGKTNPHLVFQFLVNRQNEHEIDGLHQLAAKMEVDEVRIKTVQMYDLENGADFLPKNEAYSRYKKRNDGTYELKNSFKNKCWRMWSSCVFTWDGKVVPCCFDKDARHEMGTLNKGEFQKIRKMFIYKNFRKKVFTDRKTIEICKNCSEGSKIWV